MAAFIKTKNDEFLNANVVRRVVPDKNGCNLITEVNTYPGGQETLSTLVQIIPAPGEWEALSISKQDGKLECNSVPVMAWGLTMEGFIVPITPVDRSGADVDTPLRQRGSDKIMCFAGTYESLEEWALDYLK